MNASLNASELIESIGALPWHIHAAAGVGLVLGCILWLAGGRLVKPVFVLGGLLVGLGSGCLLAGAIGIRPLGEVPASVLGSILGSVLGLVGAIILFRLAMAITGAAVLGLVGAGCVALSINVHIPQPTPTEHLAASLETGLVLAGIGVEPGPPPDPATDPPRTDPKTDPLGATVRQAADSGLVFLDDALASLKPYWESVPLGQRTAIAGGWLVGVLLGLLAGSLMPRHTSALVTAMIGSAVLLPSAAWIAVALNAPGTQDLSQPPAVWLSAWLGLAIVGVGVQWLGSARKAPAA